MNSSISITFIVVTWNSEGEILEFLGSVNKNCTDQKIEFELIIIDNNSTDNTEASIRKYNENIRNLIFIKNKENLGFTKACNQGINLAKGNYIFFINPDIKFIDKNSANILIECLNAQNEIGAVAPQLLNEDKSIQYSCRTFPTYFDMFCEFSLLSTLFPKSKIFASWKMKYFSHDVCSEVDQPMGAALLVKKDVLDKIGNFDEQFIMFFNDVDLCKRIREKGYKIIFNPQAKLIHAKGTSIYKNRIRMIRVWNSDCLKYFKKHNYNFIPYMGLKICLLLSGFLRICFYKIKFRKK